MRELLPDDGSQEDWKPRIKRFRLDLDSRLDFGIFQSGLWGREMFERFSDFMDKFHVSGWRRWFFVEPLSEIATLGLGGLMLMLALAIPAFRSLRTRIG